MTNEPGYFRFYDDSTSEQAKKEADNNYASEVGYINWLHALDIMQARGDIDAVTRRLLITRELLLRDKQIQEHQSIRERLYQEASTDTLTGLPNRRSYEEKVASLITSGQDFGLLIFDIDHFKAINDRYGHTNGDIALKEFALIASSQIRRVAMSSEHAQTTRKTTENDLFARIGGEEFVAVFPGISSAMLHTKAEAIRDSVQRTPIIIGNTPEERRTLNITTSIGGGMYRQGDNYSSLFGKIDQALYQAKHEGRNRIKIVS